MLPRKPTTYKTGKCFFCEYRLMESRLVLFSVRKSRLKRPRRFYKRYRKWVCKWCFNTVEDMGPREREKQPRQKVYGTRSAHEEKRQAWLQAQQKNSLPAPTRSPGISRVSSDKTRS